MVRIIESFKNDLRNSGARIINENRTRSDGRPPYYPTTPESNPELTLSVGSKNLASKAGALLLFSTVIGYAIGSGLDIRENQDQQPTLPQTTISQTPIPGNK